MALLIASFRNTHTRTLPVAHATALQRHSRCEPGERDRACVQRRNPLLSGTVLRKDASSWFGRKANYVTQIRQVTTEHRAVATEAHTSSSVPRSYSRPCFIT